MTLQQHRKLLKSKNQAQPHYFN